MQQTTHSPTDSSSTSSSASPNSGPRSELQKLYRHVQQISQRLDMQMKQAIDWKEWFDVENLQLRQRLRDLCEHIILSGNCGLARKAEEYLWRKSVYDIIQKLKHDKRVVSTDASLKPVMTSHLHVAMGFYHHLLIRLRNRFSIVLQGVMDWVGVPSGQVVEDVTADQVEWAFAACQRCLIYLGDIARYQLDISEQRNSRIAERYYHLAILINPDVGMPHNQLGTLKQNEFALCESAYHYMRCILSNNPFDGADENLKRILEKNTQMVINLQHEKPEHNLMSPKDQYIASFLALQEVMFGIRSISPEELAQWCQSILNLFRVVLMSPLPKKESQPVNGVKKNLSEKINTMVEVLEKDRISTVEMTSMFSICVMDTVKLSSMGSETLSAATAFTTSQLSQVLEYVAEHLHMANPLTEALLENNGEVPVQNGEQETQYAKMKRRIVQNQQKRRRRRITSTSSGQTESEEENATGDDDDLSEGELDGDVSEELSEESDAANEIDDDSEDEEDAEVARICQSAANGSISLTERKNLETLSSAAQMLNKQLKLLNHNSHLTSTNGVVDSCLMDGVEFLNSAADLLDDYQRLNDECYLPAIKLLCDFLRYHQDVLRMCAKTSPLLWKRLAMVLNRLPSQKVIQLAVMYFSRRRRVPEWLRGELEASSERAQTRALPEDVALLGTPGFEELHRSIDLAWFRGISHSELYQFALRVTYLRSFGHFLCDHEDVPCVTLHKDGVTFVVTISPSEPVNLTNSDNFPIIENNNKQFQRNNVMKAMAQQKLKYEVSELEKNLKSSHVSPSTAMSAYLVLDCAALCRHLSLLRSLVKSAQFVIIVPNQVIAALDELKKFNPGARDAIKFLEDEIKHGNRWLKSQKEHETVEDRIIMNNKKKKNRDVEEWRYLQVVKCCLYFAEKHADDKYQSSNSCVTLLTSDIISPGKTASMGMRTSTLATDACKAKGIQVEPVVDFYKRWTSRLGPP